MDRPVIIFYHLFAVNHWKEVISYQLDQIVETGLMDVIDKMYVGVNYLEEEVLEEVKEVLSGYPKVDIYHERHSKKFPVTIWNDPKVEINSQLGEGETLLKMVEFSQENPPAYYLFMHSKGASKPKDKSRSQIGYFYKKGLSESSNGNQVRRFIIKELTSSMLSDWRGILEKIEDKNFFHSLWNFFWVRSEMLEKFDFQHYRRNAPIAKRRGLKDRHFTATFPVSLYQALNGDRSIKNRRQPNILK